MSLPAPALALVLFGVVLLVVAFARHAADGPTPGVVRASPALTPGVLNPDVTQANIAETICRQGWTATIRPPTDFTQRLKLEQMRTYGLSGSPADYEEDHLVSLELGGHPTDPRNLWPEPIKRALDVDGTENDLNRRVCDGSLSLADAQRKIAEVKHEDG